ncbi:hypothetical protein FS837_006167 [Tulasnella sp. UAMH 9824]|nr:hypothetical protein FS837_006167 [Tulasnella sp. UAMH 9824]
MSEATATESLVASATSAVAEATTSAASNAKNGSLKIVGVILAIASGVLIGSSFVFKKKGLLQSQAGGPAGEGVAYLKSWLWWTGMIMMILGELCNFAAYAFVDAIVVTPLGALSVVICAILSSIFLKETLTFFGWIGCFLCIVGSIIIALNGPQEQAVETIKEFQKLFFAPGFLSSIKVSNQPSWPSLRSSWASFFVICAGIVILQMSKVDPEQLSKLDRKSTILLKAAQQEVQTSEKNGLTAVEDPGMDALRGSFGTVGSIIRARSAKRLSMSSRGSGYRPRTQSDLESNTNVADTRANRLSTHGLEHLPRHQLYDAPVRPSVDLRNSQSIDEEEAVRTPLTGKDKLSLPTSPDNKSKSPRMQSIKFGTEDVAHYYPTAGRGQAIHEQRAGRGPSSQFQHRLPSQPEFDESKFSTPKVVTPPAQVTAFGSRGAGNSYMNPFSTPPNEHPLSQVDSRSSTVMTSLSNDQSIGSLASTTGANRDSPDPFDPPEAAFRPGRRYPTSRGSDDVDESQRLVTRGRGSPDSQDEVPAPGQIRLLPSFPK